MEAFRGFNEHRIDTGEAGIACWTRWSGLLLLLFHGYPQTRVMWHNIVGRLAQNFKIFATDLRGYRDNGNARPVSSAGL